MWLSNFDFHMDKRLLLLLFILFKISDVYAYSLTPALQKLDQYIQKQINDNKAVGCAVAVLDHDQVVFLKAYGVQKKGAKGKVDLNTVFQLGSLSKPITSTLVAVLQRQGLLSLDAPAQAFFTCLKSKTKIHHILTHTTGFKRVGWNNKIESRVLREQLLKDLRNASQDEPGQSFDYHNFVYSLIEGIIEQSQNQPFRDVVYQKLFEPLGMNRATVGFTDFNNQNNKAWPHQLNKNEAIYPSKSYSHLYHAAVPSAAGINASITDIIPFLRLQLVGNTRLLNTSDLTQYHTPATEAKDALGWFKGTIKGDRKSYYGFGWRIIENNQCRIVFHGGWVKGFISFLGFLPDRKIGIVVLHNVENRFAGNTGMLFLNEWIRETHKNLSMN